MPIIKSAIKRMKQNAVRRARRYPLRSQSKTVFKTVLMLIKDGKKEEAEKMVPHVHSVIDTAVKKHILHANTAARKKSRLAKALNAMGAEAVAAPAKKAEKAEKEESE